MPRIVVRVGTRWHLLAAAPSPIPLVRSEFGLSPENAGTGPAGGGTATFITALVPSQVMVAHGPYYSGCHRFEKRVMHLSRIPGQSAAELLTK